LAAIRNVAQGEALDIAPLDPEAFSEPRHDRDSADLDLAVAGHPRLAAREAAIEAAEQVVEAERLSARPDFTVMTRYGARPLGADFFSAFVGVRVPLWAGRKQHRLADAARADVLAARAQLEEERNQLTAEVATILARIRASQARIAILADRVLPAAREAVEGTMRGYKVGQVDFLNLLSVQDGLYRTELETAELLADHLTHLVMLEQLLAPGANND
jgi:outer membrane protein TolC